MANPGPPLPKDSKNYYHPLTEQEIIDMVKYASQHKLELRVRGSLHSFARNIFTDKCSLNKIDVEASAPDGNNINLMLDKYTKIESYKGSLVTVQAGICLGYNPEYPEDTAENCLLHQLYNRGLTLDDLGGVTRQTVSGFLSTGSSGGSVTYSIDQNVYALRFIDGTGEVYEVSQDDDDQDLFHAAKVSMGLLGVLSKITFKCSPTFNIKGVQRSSTVNKSVVDIYDDNPSDPERKGLTSFLTETPYARILWWPQTSCIAHLEQERLQVWQAERIEPTDGFKREPFKLFDCSEEMMLYSFLMTLMGNIEDMEKVREIMAGQKSRFDWLLHKELTECHHLPKPEIEMITRVLNLINDLIFNLCTRIGDHIIPREIRRDILPVISAVAMNILTRLDGKTDKFQDHAYLGLPMDNTADDILVPTMFTEIWVPLTYATRATRAIRDYFNGPPDDQSYAAIVIRAIKRFFGGHTPEDCYSRTGNNAWELYAAKASDAWMSMSYSNGDDVWKYGAFRIDPYWFILNSEDYIDLYRPIWILLHKQNIPFRLHWGKIFPKMDDSAYDWRSIIVKNQFPRLAEFLAFRELKDPNGIFLSSFWRYWFDIE